MASDFDETRLHEYDDATLAEFIERAPRTSSTMGGVRCLSPSLVSKTAGPTLHHDALKGICLARQLGIRVPAVRRVVEIKDLLHSCYTIMERIDGTTLHDCWHQLSWFTTLRLALQLRRWVRKMRTQTSPTAGGLDSGQFNSPWVEDSYGLPDNASPRAVGSYFDFWGNFIPPPIGTIPKRPAKLKIDFSSMTTPLYFTHQDLAPRNLMIDTQGQLWVVDWTLSGWFPIYLEYTGMQNFLAHSWGWFDRLRWRLFTWISVGWYEAEKCAIRGGVSWSIKWRNGRRGEVLVEGADPWDFNARRPGL